MAEKYTVHDYTVEQILNFIKSNEIAEQTLSNTFWNVEVVQNLETSSINSPSLSVFWAVSCRDGSDSLFNEGSKFSNLITTMGDVHHIFPKEVFN